MTVLHHGLSSTHCDVKCPERGPHMPHLIPASITKNNRSPRDRAKESDYQKPGDPIVSLPGHLLGERGSEREAQRERASSALCVLCVCLVWHFIIIDDLYNSSNWALAGFSRREKRASDSWGGTQDQLGCQNRSSKATER